MVISSKFKDIISMCVLPPNINSMFGKQIIHELIGVNYSN